LNKTPPDVYFEPAAFGHQPPTRLDSALKPGDFLLGLLLWYPASMAKKGTPKKRPGRPPTTGRGTQIGMRWHTPELAAIDKWRTKHRVDNRPDAIRRLVEIGLKTKTK